MARTGWRIRAGARERIQAFLAATALAAVAAALLYTQLPKPLLGVDDANIYLAYAQNLASGHGFVYNPGGEHVEGFTSLLWVLVGTLAVAVSSHAELGLLAINVLLVAVAVASVVAFALDLARPGGDADARRWPPKLTALAVLGWVFLSPGYFLWTTVSLMESALWGVVLVLGTIFAAWSVRRRQPNARYAYGGFAVLIALSLLTRPEAMLVAAVWIVAHLVAVTGLKRDWRSGLRSAVLPAATYAGTSIALLAFRLAYFGYPLPNTYYAKVAPSFGYNLVEGAGYLAGFLYDYPLAALCLASAIWVVFDYARSWRRIDETRTMLFVVSLSVLTVISTPLATGGDHFTLYRFYQPIWPLLVVPPLGLAFQPAVWNALRTAVGKLDALARRRLVVTGLLLVVYASYTPRWDQVLRGWGLPRGEFRIANEGREVGEALNAVLVGGAAPSVGVYRAGGIAVTYRGRVVDLMGLNEVRMAHSSSDRRGYKNHAAFDLDVFFTLAPDLVIPRIVRRDSAAFHFRDQSTDWWEEQVLRGLYQTRRFQERYTPVSVRLPDGVARPEDVLVAWSRRDVVATLRRAGIRLAEVR